VRLSIKTKQVAGVTLVVGLVAVALTVWFLAAIVRLRLEETRDRAQTLGNVVLQGAFSAVAAGTDPYALQEHPTVRSALDASLLDERVLYAAIVDVNRVVIAHYDPDMVNTELPAPVGDDLASLIDAGPIAQLDAIYRGGLRTYEVRIPLLLGALGDASDLREFGHVVIGFSTGLMREELNEAMRAPIYTALAAILLAMLIALPLAQLMLRPIHVIRSSLARLGRGELDVDVELPDDRELGDIGDSLKAVSARLAADRSQLAGQRATLESVVEHLEDAVAIVAPDDTLLFANAAMSQTLGAASGHLPDLLPDGHPYREAIRRARTPGAASEPHTVSVPDAGERLVIAEPIAGGGDDGPLGVLLVARNLDYLSQVESTLSYSRKLAALGRLSAGIAHEVKNPLNATMIHLELLRGQLKDQPDAQAHLTVITAQMRRLDEVVQGFLKFTRPEELRLRPVTLLTVLDRVLPIIEAEAESHGITVDVNCPADLPDVSADDGLLEQAFLNLGLNACQAMPGGGRLRIAAAAAPQRRVAIAFEDSGVGIPPESLERIFDLYYTTKHEGSGIGLSLVYRTIQLHDGEIEVQSVPGRGTTFRILLWQATEKPAAPPVPAS